MLKRLKIIGYVVIGGVGIIALLGFSVERVIQRQVRSQFPAPGQLVNVGDHQLHLLVTGQANDQPTVILEAGNGGFSTQWVRVQDELSQQMQVVSYDRAGYGWSEPSPYPVDLTRNAQDLQTALDTLGIAPPYILVGHSMGGLFNLSYAAHFPEHIAGMVFVDTTHPDMWQHFPEAMMDQQNNMIRLMRVMQVAAHFGVMRIINPLAAAVVDLPADEQEVSLALSANAQYISTFLQEAEIVSNLPQSMPPLSDLSNIPLVVLSANSAPDGQTMPEGIFETMHGLHQQLATLSDEGLWRVLDGSNHYSIVMSEPYALELVQAVLELTN